MINSQEILKRYISLRFLRSLMLPWNFTYHYLQFDAYHMLSGDSKQTAYNHLNNSAIFSNICKNILQVFYSQRKVIWIITRLKMTMFEEVYRCIIMHAKVFERFENFIQFAYKVS